MAMCRACTPVNQLAVSLFAPSLDQAHDVAHDRAHALLTPTTACLPACTLSLPAYPLTTCLIPYLQITVSSYVVFFGMMMMCLECNLGNSE